MVRRKFSGLGSVDRLPSPATRRVRSPFTTGVQHVPAPPPPRAPDRVPRPVHSTLSHCLCLRPSPLHSSAAVAARRLPNEKPSMDERDPNTQCTLFVCHRPP
eukprot:3196934-Prymnesium_polylepis.1